MFKDTDWNALAKEVRQLNEKWWVDIHTGEPLNRNIGELCMLIVSELAEAMEHLRKGTMDDKLPYRNGVEVELADTLIRVLDFAGGFDLDIEDWRDQDSFDDIENQAEALFVISMDVQFWYQFDLEISQGYDLDEDVNPWFIISKILAFAEKFGYDLEGAFWEKLEYNKTRADHKVENRLKDGGKKF